MKSYKDLDVWKESRKMVKTIYLLTQNFPKEETYGLTQQIRRSAISIPSNIAEGHGRNTAKDSIQFFHISRGSLYELETQVYLAFDLGYTDEKQCSDVIEQISTNGKMLNGLINYFEKLK
ncbi:MAG: four helix bundle protein [Bacteroidetes bacterium]|nr:MAG: four helix bundle protein [Bacteroidota bacterium]